jgi:hypothetical protein
VTYNLRNFMCIRRYLKAAIKPWRDAIIKAQRGRCRISQQYRHVDVHHVSKSFSAIIKETFAVTGIAYRPETCDYTPEELALLAATCLDLHRNVIGVLVARRLHEEYHRQYNECTADNWREFKRQYKPRRRVS